MFPNTPYTKSMDFHGDILTLQTGLLAKQATSSVVASLGDTTVMANVVIGKPRGADYFPLQVIYEERLYAAGKIKGSRFIKREGKPTDQAILTGRMIDRSLRSLFNSDLRNEIQVVVTVLSIDEVNPPDTLAVLAASTAVSMCGLGDYFRGPVSTVRIGTKKNDIKNRLIENILVDIEKATDYSQFAEKIETICQVFDLKNEADKEKFKKVFDALKAKNRTWVDNLKTCYQVSHRMTQEQINKALGGRTGIVVNPSYKEQIDLDLDLVVSGDGRNIMMVEAGGNIISEATMGKCIDQAVVELKSLTDFQQKFLHEVTANIEVTLPQLETVTPDQKYTRYWQNFETQLTKAMYAEGSKKQKERILNEFKTLHKNNLESLQKILDTGKISSVEQLQSMVSKFTSSRVKVKLPDCEIELDKSISQEQVSLLNNIKESVTGHTKDLFEGLYKVISEVMKRNILHKDLRVDGRPLNKTRDILCLVDVLPRTHGSSLFQRGETQVMNILTIGTKRDAQILDDMEDFEEGTKRYIHHYNFPPYSVGETGRYGPPSRREIGHGSLAEKALLPVLPDEDDFPYTMRLVSECLGSNGSTSMASTCSSCLSLMSGGVPIKDMVAGVAMGLMLDSETGKFKVLTDIQGLEDHHGDMDFKVTGTKEGITAIQLDNKVAGLTPEILKLALHDAYEARMHILGIMKETIKAPKKEMSPYAPRVAMLQLPADKIGDVIGPSGKIIKSIIAKTDTEIEINDDGQTFIYGRELEKVKNAVDIIKNLIKEYEVGDIVKAKIFRIEGFGAFGKIDGGEKEGMIHISELENGRTGKVEDVVNMGDEVEAKIIEIKNNGQIGLSLKALLPESEKPAPKQRNNRKTRDDKPAEDPQILA